MMGENVTRKQSYTSCFCINFFLNNIRAMMVKSKIARVIFSNVRITK